MDTFLEDADTLSQEIVAGLATFGLDVLGALAILAAGWVLAAWTGRAIRRTLTEVFAWDATLTPILAQIARYTILALALVAILAQFGIQTASIIAVLGAAGIAVGLALQGMLSNIASGIMLLALRPLKVGEYVDADGVAGTVDEIGLFATTMRTFDGVFLSVPNTQLWNRTIRNYSRLPTRRLDIPVGVSYGDDIGRGLQILEGLIAGESRILGEPAPEVMVTDLADSAVILNLRCWVKRDDYWNVRFGLTRAAKEAIEAGGLTIPFPQRDIHITGHITGRTGEQAGG